MRSPRIAPPENGEEGSTARTPTFFPAPLMDEMSRPLREVAEIAYGEPFRLPEGMETGLEVRETVAGVRPLRVAVTVIVPGVSVDRTKTRLIPASVSRVVLLIEPTMPLL